MLTSTTVPRSGSPRPGLTRLRERQQILAPSLHIAETPAAAVLRASRTQGPISRDTAARLTGLSIATVNRQVTALHAVGLLRERADLSASGAIGRPRVPFEINHEPYLTLGIHIGARATSIVASDLRGRILGVVEVPTPRGHQDAALLSIADSASTFATRWHRRRPLWVGVAIGGRVESQTATVDHPRLGWTGAPVGRVLTNSLRLPVSVAAHVEAMAASELLLAPQRDRTLLDSSASGRVRLDSSASDRTRGSGLYFYARETVGIALTLDGRVHTPSTGAGSISHLPIGRAVRCDVANTGRLEDAVSDRAVVRAAEKHHIIPAADASTNSIKEVYRAAADGSIEAHELLVERAQILGRSIALLRDIFNPDEVILGGQAFTEYPAGISHLEQAFAEASVLPRKRIRISGFGNRVQEVAAGVVSLGPLYSDPLSCMRKATVR